MKKNFPVDARKKTGALLVAILAVIMMLGYAHREDYRRLDKNIRSLYSDRLLPSVYLFQMHDYLYRQQMLLEHGVSGIVNPVEVEKCRLSIDSLATAYEKTYLTAGEKTLWISWKTGFTSYEKVASQMLAASYSTEYLSSLQENFNRNISVLQQLSQLQNLEGEQLHTHSMAIVSGSFLQGTLQNALLFLLGILLLKLLLMGNKQVQQTYYKHLLN